MRLVLDWDGTVTEVDTLHLVLGEFGDLGVFRAMEAELGRRLTLHEVIATEMATVTAPLEDVVAWLREHAALRPGFAELVRDHRPVVVSAGFHELIEPLLVREGITVPVIANRVVDAAPTGWRVAFRDTTPCPVCGEPCKRAAAGAGGAFAYAGDGMSDRCAALAADRVFARAGLARFLDGEGVSYETFDDLHDVAAALEAASR
jgi:2-hydroxy-3-keto-5-methylthiopentenyl-1-phosphate phosphatase